MGDKLPAIQFYTRDYLADTAHLSLAANGAWIFLLCVMNHSQKRGEVEFKSVGALAKALRTSVSKTQRIKAELLDKQNPTMNGVCDCEEFPDGSFKLISRRILRDERLRDIRAEAGSKGGMASVLKRSGLPNHLLKQTNQQNSTPSAPARAGAHAEDEDEDEESCIGNGGPGENPSDPVLHSALEAFAQWSHVMRGHGLKEFENEHRPIINLITAVSDSPPILQGERQIGQANFIPLACEHLKIDRVEFKSAKYAASCVRSKLSDWATKGLPGASGATPSRRRSRVEESTAELEALRDQYKAEEAAK